MLVANRIVNLAVLVSLLLLSGCESKDAAKNRPAVETSIEKTAEPSDERNPKWAARIELDGCPNLHKVSDVLYRGAQPEDEGLVELEKMGIKTVVNLRKWHSDRDELEGTGVEYVPIKMKTWEPEEKHVIAFLKTVRNQSKQPVFVHCQHGADRTGTMVAIYRIVEQGWEKDDAIKEMVEGGYNYHSMWTMLPKFIRELDVEKIRKEISKEE